MALLLYCLTRGMTNERFLVYAGFAVSETLPGLLTWFMIYGVYYGCVEGSERALIADFALPSLGFAGTPTALILAASGSGWRIWKYPECRMMRRNPRCAA